MSTQDRQDNPCCFSTNQLPGAIVFIVVTLAAAFSRRDMLLASKGTFDSKDDFWTQEENMARLLHNKPAFKHFSLF